MKIAVFEIDYHFVQLFTFCWLFEGSSHEITVFTTKGIYDRIKDDPIARSCKWVVKDNEGLGAFIEKNLSEINSNDLIFFNTIASGYRTLYKANFKIPSILRIHNAHTYLKPFQHLYMPKNLFELYKSVSYVLREMLLTLDFYYIGKLIKKIDFVCLNDYYREEYVIQEHLIAKEKIFPCLPFALSNSMSKEIDPERQWLTIVIPGSIDQRKRDYLSVIAAFRKAVTRLNKKVTIYLLGKPVGKYGKEVIAMFREMENERLQVVSFHSALPQEKFDSAIRDSDMILAPMVLENQFRIYKEIYGKSKSSGSVSDMIGFGKMTIFPVNFFNDSLLEEHLDKYDSSDSLASIVVNYANDRSLLVKRSTGLRRFLAENYSSKKILKDFEKNCDERIVSKGRK